jgi:hypothetical protein
MEAAALEKEEVGDHHCVLSRTHVSVSFHTPCTHLHIIEESNPHYKLDPHSALVASIMRVIFSYISLRSRDDTFHTTQLGVST